MGIIHGSLKPSNIIVSDDVHAGPRIVDFGTRRIVAALQDELFAVKTPYGLVYGELAYLAPEQIIGEPTDARTDVYAVGLIMYELLTGARPFRQEDPADLAAAQVDERALAPRDFKPQLKIPKFMEKAIMNALEKKPRKRQDGAGELLEQLQGEIVPEEAEPKSVWQRAKAAVAPKPAAKEEAPPPPPLVPEETPDAASKTAARPTVAPQVAAEGARPSGGAAGMPPAPAAEMTGPRFVLYEGKEVKEAWPVVKDEMRVGRSAECDIAIDDRTVSRVHARISRRPDRIVVEDLNSLNGTYINDDAIKRGHVEDGDVVSFGNVALIFRNT